MDLVLGEEVVARRKPPQAVVVLGHSRKRLITESRDLEARITFTMLAVDSHRVGIDIEVTTTPSLSTSTTFA